MIYSPPADSEPFSRLCRGAGSGQGLGGSGMQDLCPARHWQPVALPSPERQGRSSDLSGRRTGELKNVWTWFWLNGGWLVRQVSCKQAASLLEYLLSPNLWDLSFILPRSPACAAGGGSGGFPALFPKIVIWAGGGKVGPEGSGNTLAQML